jgi:hypothetical protein
MQGELSNSQRASRARGTSHHAHITLHMVVILLLHDLSTTLYRVGFSIGTTTSKQLAIDVGG